MPALEEFLPPRDSPARLPALHRLILMDLEARWSRGGEIPKLLDQYVRELPELGRMESLPINLIFQEYRARHIYGDRPALEAYHSRFPRQFEALQRMVRELEGALQPPTPDGSLIATIRDFPPPPPPSLPPLPESPPKVTPGEAAGGSVIDGMPIPTLPTFIPPTVRPPAAPNNLGDVAGWTASSADLATHYHLIRVLGQGQFGEVFLAEAPGGHPAAVKRMLHHLNEESSRKELQSLELLRKLRHPFLLEIHASWVQDNRLHIAMQLADGSLLERFGECKKAGLRGIPRDELINYFEELAEAVDYLHSKGVMHRDIKPANLLLHGGHAKVADFGLARHLQPDEISGTFCGTPAFMGPEVYSGQVSFPADQYSLACSYVEMRRGEPPYSGRNAFVLAQQVLNQQPNLQGIPRAEQQVLLRALAKEPDERFPTCSDFVRALRQAAAPPRRATSPWPIIVALCILLLGLGTFSLLWVFTRSIPEPVPSSARSAKLFVPPGFSKAEESESSGLPKNELQTIPELEDTKLWRFVRSNRPPAAAVTLVLLSPREKCDEPRSFYISRTKITRDQFRKAFATEEMQAILKTLKDKVSDKDKHKGLYFRDRWAKKPGPKDLPEQEKDWPVDEVTVPEAYAFARYIAGDLGDIPTQDQWDRASNRCRSLIPYREELWRQLVGKVEAINHKYHPVPVGKTDWDVCDATGCCDLAGDGVEMLHETVYPVDKPLFPFAKSDSPAVRLRGALWGDPRPFDFINFEQRDTRPLRYNNTAVGFCFRIVVTIKRP
jgi:serine/threonine protein kinase